MILEKLTEAVQLVLKPGAAVFMPLIIMFFVMILRAYDKKSISWFQGIRSAILLGVAFLAIGIVIGFTINIFNTPFAQIQKLLSYNSLDLGWAPMSALSWAWPYAFLLFPIQIFTNIAMLKLNKTKTLNADLWNVWNKVFTSVLVTFILTPSVGPKFAVALGLFAGWIQVIFELKNGDVLYEKQYLITGIPNINSPHSMFLLSPIVDFVDRFLQKIPYFAKDVEDSDKKQSIWVKILGENVMAGFLVGLLVSGSIIWLDKGNWALYLQLPFMIACALALFPVTAKFFTQALTPIGSAIQTITQQKFQDKEIYVGLDFPILAGNAKLWLVATMMIPFTLIYSIIFSFIPGFKAAFPLGGMINVCLAPIILVICKQNMRRMVATGIILTPIFLFFASYIAPVMTNAAIENRSVLSGVDDATFAKLGKNLWITSTTMNMPDATFALAGGLLFLTGMFTSPAAIAGIIWACIWILLWRRYYKLAKIDAIELRKQREAKNS